MTHLPVDASLALRAVGEASPDLVYVVLHNGTVAYANEAAAQLAGLTADTIVGRRWSELGLPFDLQETRELTTATESGTRTFAQFISPMHDAAGEALGVAVTARDVTEHRASEDELRAQRRFREAVNRSLRPGLATMDLEGRLTSASDSFVEMFGWSADEVVTFGPPYPFWPPEEIEHIRAQFVRVMAAQDRAQPPLEFIFRRRNDERFPVLVQPSALFDEQGAVVGWVAIITDISNQHAAEQRYRDLADSMPQIVWSARADGVIDYFNRRWYEFTGMEQGAVGDDSWTPVLHPDDVERTVAIWYASVRSGRPYQIEYRFHDRTTGEYRWHLGRAVPVVDANGTVVRWYGTSTEIDQLKHAESEVVRRGEVLERQNFMLRTLLDVSEVLSAELDLEKVLQSVTLAATMLTGAEYGALWFDGELRALSGIPPEALETFVAASALEVPILSRAGAPIGQLVFGHSQAGKLGEEAERLVTGVAAQAAIAIDNARAAAELRAEEGRYRTLVTATSQIVWSTDADGTPRGDTSGWLELTGGSAEESENDGWLQHIHPDDQERMLTTWRNALETSQAYTLELRIRTADRTYRWFLVRGVPLRNDDGTVREWIGTSTDIDARKRAAEATSFLADASALLTESLDPETILSRLAHLAVPRLADWCAIDIAREQAPHQRLIIAHPDQEKAAMVMEVDRDYRVPDALNPVVNVLTTGTPQLLEYIEPSYVEGFAQDERHLEIIRALGLTSWVIVPIIAGGRTYGTLSLLHSYESGRRFSQRDLEVIEDLAGRVGVAVHNAALYVEAEAANRAKDEFLATLSHELRTPMTAILGWARLLELGDNDPLLVQEGIQSIARSARAQAQLIDDLLDVSRISAGKLALTLTDISVNDVVAAAAEAVRATANVKSIALELHRDEQVPYIAADASRLQQVVWNLLSNAVKFTPNGGRVDVTVESSGETASIIVTDTGEGFAPEFVPFMFDRFRQADSTTTRRFGGLGLGLSIVKQITELLAGSIEAFSPGPGRGATFTLTFPLVRTAAAKEPPMLAAPLPRFDGLDILVVDDDPQARRFIAAALERAGAAVRDAGSVDEAMLAIRARIPAVLVSDIAMPDRDGFALLEDVRNLLHIDEQRLPAIAITAFGGTQDRVRILAAGFQRYILKPVDPLELARVIAEVLPAA